MSTLEVKQIQAPTGYDLQMPAGHIISTYTDVITSAVTFSSSSYVDSGLSITLTPKSTSSKFIIQIYGKTAMDNTSENAGMQHKILRDSTTISSANHMNYWNRLDYSDDYYPTMNVTYIDSPNTTSSITYKMQGSKYSGSLSSWTLAENNGGDSYASLIIMEVAG